MIDPAMPDEDDDGRISGDAVEATRVVVAEATRVGAGLGRSGARALVLTGSVARGEATVLRHAGELVMLSDVEFLLVLEKGIRLSSDTATAARQAIEAAALRRGVRCTVEVALVHADFLRNLPPHVFTYELRTCGKVIWGDGSVLALIRPLTAGEIDREDGWRLLANRIIEQLVAREEPAEDTSEPARRMGYHTVKLFLDMATSLLVFTGDYAPTYRQRAERLCRLAAQTSRGLPFPLQEFATRVSQFTSWKLRPGEAPWPSGHVTEEARSYARGLWRWELQQLTGLGEVLDERVLMERWMTAQPYRARVRGWLSAGRRCGWLRGWRRWPRFLRLATRSSPRYLVYAVATELFFASPHGSADTEDRSADPVTLARRLPLVEQGRGRGIPALASDIARNYRGLLVGTRA